MGSLLRSVKKRKKSRRLGEVEMVRHEDYGELALDAKEEMIRSLVPLGLMHVHELLDDEVKALAGERYSRKDELERGRRHGVLPPSSVGKMTLRLYGALNYSPNSVRDLRFALYGA